MFDICYCFFFQTKTAYELRISDWSSDVCSSDLITSGTLPTLLLPTSDSPASSSGSSKERPPACSRLTAWALRLVAPIAPVTTKRPPNSTSRCQSTEASISRVERRRLTSRRSEEHTSELQSLMRTSYAVFCLKKNKNHND